VKEFKATDTNRFFLPGTDRFLHIASVSKGLRQFICFVDKQTEKMYVEEITTGQLEFIDDDSLAEAVTNFLAEKKIISASKPTLPDFQWLPTNKTKKYYI
jgi:hypothetical protein